MASPKQYISANSAPLSPKQLETLFVIARGNQDGSHVNRYEIAERLSYSPTPVSIEFMMRYMIAQGRVARAERVNGKQTYKITEAGYRLISEEFSSKLLMPE